MVLSSDANQMRDHELALTLVDVLPHFLLQFTRLSHDSMRDQDVLASHSKLHNMITARSVHVTL